MNSVRNVLAITEKELRSYFASPIAYIIIGLFSLLLCFFMPVSFCTSSAFPIGIAYR